MRICAISDLHGHLPGSPVNPAEYWRRALTRSLPGIQPCDVLAIAGDLMPVWDHSFDSQVRFLDGPFRRWLESVPARHIVAIAGNHDSLFEKEPELVPLGLRWKWLEDQAIVIEGVKFYGTPWTPSFMNWAYNLPENELAEMWELIPDDTDVLISHGPPRGYGDLLEDGDRVGSPSLTERIFKVKPKLCAYGHIHSGAGVWPQEWGTLANVSLRNEKYEIVNPPMYFDL